MSHRRTNIPALKTLRRELAREEKLTAQALGRAETFFARAPVLYEERSRRSILQAAEQRGLVAAPQFTRLGHALRDPRTRGASPLFPVGPQRAPRLLRRRTFIGALIRLLVVLALFTLFLWWVSVLYG
ncbi:MAG: hypothetical protein SNJ52_04815 [Verrucomicrobiia bacterium]